jgi:PAS domain S-box-containing protein
MTQSSLNRDQPALTADETLASELKRLRARVAFLERLETRREQQNGDLLYEAILSVTPDLLFRIDRDGAYIEVGSDNEHMLLFPRERYKGNTLHGTLAPDVADLLLNRIRQALDTGTIQIVEFRLQGPAGSLEREGRIVAIGPDEVLLIVRDITEKRRAEATLGRLSRQHELILEAAGEGIYGVDAQGIATFLNPAGAHMLGYEVDELIGQSSHNLMHHSRPDGTPYPWDECPVAATLREGITQHVDGEIFRRKDGSGFPVEFTSTPMIEGGQIVGAVVTFRDISKRKATEEAFAREHSLLRILVDNVPDLIYAKDTEGRKLLANMADARFMGLRNPDEAIGKTDFDFYPHEQAAQFHADDMRVIQSGKPVINREEAFSVDGESHWLLTTKVPLRDSQGRVIGLVGIGHDVTERKRTADALAHYAKRLDVLYSLEQSVLAGLSIAEVAIEALQGFCQLVPCVSAAMALFDTRANTTQIVMVGHYGEQVLNRGEEVPLDTFRQPDGSLRPRQAIIADLATYDSLNPIDQGLLSSGTRSCMSSPLVVEDTILGILVLGSDAANTFGVAHRVIATQLADQLAVAMSHIRLREQVQQYNAELTERVRERTAELERTRSRVEAILNNSSDAIILARPDSVISQVNPMFDQLFGYEPDALFHHPLIAIAHPASAGVLQEALVAVVQAGVIEHLEIVALRNDGSTFDAEVGLSLIEVAEEQLSGIVCNIHDITQRKQAEAELLKALETERELSELKTRFVSMASHEFRTPLTTIFSSTEILERYLDKMNPEQKGKHFARILTAAQHMTELLEEVLILGRINAGQLQCHPAPLDLKQMAQDALEQVRLTTGPNIELAVSIGGARTTANLDEKLMRHILTNLLSNAVKYSPQGGKVHFHLDCGSDDAIIRVQDEGIGIPQKDLERLFEPFHRAGNVDTIPGTGLGLAITKQAVDLQHGSITVESEVGVGTTFTVTLPVDMPVEEGA